MVQRIIAEVKAECEATGGDSQRRGYTKHWYFLVITTTITTH